jgi:hypothetical protein
MIEIPHITAKLSDCTAGNPGWGTVQDTTGKILKPLIRCNCGKWVGIALHHVHTDGTVTASFYHSKGTNYAIGESPDGCGWHVFLKLKDYDLGDFPPEPC